MRKFILSCAAAATLAAGAIAAPRVDAAPFASQIAVTTGAGTFAPTDQVSYRRHYRPTRRHFAPRRIYRRHVYRPAYYYGAPEYYPAPVYSEPYYVAPVVVPFFGYGGGYGYGGGWGHHGGWGGRH